LSAAWKLRKLGVEDLVVLELEKETGGTSLSSSWAAGRLSVGSALFAGAVSRECRVIELLDEMLLTEGRTAEGDLIVKEQFLCRDPEERFFTRAAGTTGFICTRARVKRTSGSLSNSKSRSTRGSTGETAAGGGRSLCLRRIVRTMLR
jgi:hypothetical protein